jgi:ankyrin repeat protein
VEGQEDLFEAIDAGDLGKVRSLLAREPSLAAVRDARGLSALTAARYGGHNDILEALLDSGPELDIFDAAAIGRADRVVELLDGEPELVRA